jgi:hypothetical protein
MFNSFLNFTNKYASVIAFIALLCSFYSIYLTKHSNKIKILINYPYSEEILSFHRYSFSIYNDSNVAVNINSIEILHLDNTPVKIYQYDIEEYYEFKYNMDIHNYNKKTKSNGLSDFNFISSPIPFKDIASSDEYFSMPNNDIIEPHSYYDVVFFSFDFLNQCKIKIKTDKKISMFSKTKSFIVQFQKSNQYNYIQY